MAVVDPTFKCDVELSRCICFKRCLRDSTTLLRMNIVREENGLCVNCYIVAKKIVSGVHARRKPSALFIYTNGGDISSGDSENGKVKGEN